MYEIVHQATYRFFGNDEVYKLVMDDMYEIGWIWIFWNWLKFEYEFSRICTVSVVKAQTWCWWWNPRWCRYFGCLGCACFFVFKFLFDFINYKRPDKLNNVTNYWKLLIMTNKKKTTKKTKNKHYPPPLPHPWLRFLDNHYFLL